MSKASTGSGRSSAGFEFEVLTNGDSPMRDVATIINERCSNEELIEFGH